MSIKIDYNTPELDYCLLKHLVSDRKFVRNAISVLVRNSTLIHVKKGLYVNTAASLPSLGVLANMIYGPSYVSQEYALYHYGLIAEQPKMLTSMTLKMRKSFKTTYGIFSYEQITKKRFFIGTTIVTIGEGRGFIIATPEKALCDKFSRVSSISTPQEALDYCTEDLRIEAHELRKRMSLPLLKKIAQAFQDKSVDNLYKAICKLKKE